MCCCGQTGGRTDLVVLTDLEKVSMVPQVQDLWLANVELQLGSFSCDMDAWGYRCIFAGSLLKVY